MLARVTAYETKCRTSGAATQQVVQLPPASAGARPGARHLISLEFEGAGGDSVRINAGSGARLRREEIHIAGVTGYTAETITNVDLAAAGDFALFEWLGGANGDWNLIYASAGVTVS